MTEGRRTRQSAGPTRYSPAASDDVSDVPVPGATERRDATALMGADRLSLLVAGEGVYATYTLPASGTAIIGRAGVGVLWLVLVVKVGVFDVATADFGVSSTGDAVAAAAAGLLTVMISPFQARKLGCLM